MGGGTTNFPGGWGPWRTSGYVTSPNTLYSDSVALPTNRRQAHNGSRPILVYRAKVSLGGYGGSRSCRIYVDSASTSAFTVGSAGAASDTGWRSLSLLTTGGNKRVKIYGNGGFYFGRGPSEGGGATRVDGSGSLVHDESIAGQCSWYEVPSAPSSVSAADLGGGTVRASWGAPSDNGGTSITGYYVQIDDNSSFTSPTSVDKSSGSSSHDFAGLTPGGTYYVRVFAKNAVTAAAGTYSVASSTASVDTGDVPDAPTSVVATAGAGYLGISWAAPASDGGVAISSYTVEWSTDAGFSGSSTVVVGSAARAHTVAGPTPDSTYYVRVYATNAVGTSAASSSDSEATPVRDALDVVRGTSVAISGGVTCSIISDAADVPTLTLVYRPFGSATPTTIATLAGFYTPGGAQNLAIVADASGNLYVIGVDASATSSLRVAYFSRGGATSWTYVRALAGALTSTGDALAAVSAAYAPGTGGSPISSILALVRRFGARAAGAVSFALLNVSAIQSGSGSLFLSSGSNPSWLSTPPSAAPRDTGDVGAAQMGAGSTRIAVHGDAYAVVDVVNGAITTRAKDAAGAYTTEARRTVGIDSTRFARVGPTAAGALSWEIRSDAGALLGSGTIDAALFDGGAADTTSFDALYDPVARVVRIYALDSTSTRSVRRWNVSIDSYGVTTALALTTSFGGSGSTNSALRVARGPVDERAVVIDGANLDGSTHSVTASVDTFGNVAPGSPSLATLAGYDASLARAFTWTFGDQNPADTQTAYQLQVERVSDSATVYDSTKMTSAVASHTIPAASFANGVDYRWRVRTYDALDAVGEWSSFDAFTASALGDLEVTTPATDNVAGIDTSSIAVAWTYTQGDGYVQTQRRVKVVRTSDGATLSDTTMQASAVGSFEVTDLPTDEEIRVEVTIVTNAPGTPTVGPASRLITASYGAPMTPEIAVAEIGDVYVAVVVTNPTPSGDRPEIERNVIERRVSDPDADFVAIGSVGRNGTFYDYTVASGVAYDYRAKGSTE